MLRLQYAYDSALSLNHDSLRSNLPCYRVMTCKAINEQNSYKLVVVSGITRYPSVTMSNA
jgi:hypothetical protein